MNMIMMVGASSRGGSFSGCLAGEPCALVLFISGAVLLAIAAYLIAKAPAGDGLQDLTR